MSDGLGWTALACCGLLAAGIAVPATAALARLARRLDVVDRPRADRFNAQATPLLGGVAIAAAAVLVAAAGWTIAGAWSVPAAALMTGCVALALLGLYDDVSGAGLVARVAVEFVVAVALVLAGVRLPIVGAPAVDAVLTAVLLVVLANSYNLLDNSDAALGSVAAVTGVGIVALAVALGVPDQGVLAATTAGAALGFLVLNRPPARVFMGDAGSLFLGLSIVGSLALVTAPTGTPQPVPIAALLVVPLADTTVVTITRVREGRRISGGGKDHVHHRLARTGLAVGGAVLVAASITAAGALVALAVATTRLGAVPGLVLVIVLGGGLASWALRQWSGHPATTPGQGAP